MKHYWPYWTCVWKAPTCTQVRFELHTDLAVWRFSRHHVKKGIWIHTGFITSRGPKEGKKSRLRGLRHESSSTGESTLFLNLQGAQILAIRDEEPETSWSPTSSFPMANRHSFFPATVDIFFLFLSWRSWVALSSKQSKHSSEPAYQPCLLSHLFSLAPHPHNSCGILHWLSCVDYSLTSEGDTVWMLCQKALACLEDLWCCLSLLEKEILKERMRI